MSSAPPQGSFFRSLRDGKEGFDPEKFLTEVDSQFKSEEITHEVRWRLSVLKEIASQPEFSDVGEGLRAKLTQIFSKSGDEQVILGDLKKLTEVRSKQGEAVELRRFLKREKRTLSEGEYRNLLSKKTQNTESQILNLIAFFPDSKTALQELANQTKKLIQAINNPAIPIKKVKATEDQIRQSPAFEAYEEYKLNFLRDWLGQFANLSPKEIEGLSPEEIQQLVVEHQRHQMTQLLKTKIVPNETDMTEHLGLHDTLECGFGNKEFWTGANQGAKTGFRQWILAVIQSFGMLKGQRYAFFQAKDADEQYLLFGVGVSELPGSDQTLSMVPYLKPFTRKAGYLLEIRKRELGDPDQYHHELRHYVLPFLFAFDQMQNFSLNKELISFFTSNY